MLSPRFSALTALAALALVGPAYGQRSAAMTRPQIIPFPVNPNQQVVPNQTARQLGYNVAVLGQAASNIPPWLYGYNPYPPTIINPGPLLPQVSSPLLGGGVSPYALSTFPVGGGVGVGGGTLGTSPYSLSTVPGSGIYGNGFTPFYPPFGYIQDPYSATVQGLASLTSATGQYYVNIQQARLLREQSRQMSLDTTRKRLELEAYYETIRPTAPKMMAAQKATDLEVARRFATDTDINSGRALNTLLANMPVTGLNKGDNIALDADTLKSLNLSGGTSGNVGMLKGGLKDNSWPEALQAKDYADARKQLQLKLNFAVENLKAGTDLDSGLIADIRKYFRSIKGTFDETSADLDMQQYITAKRFLTALGSAVEGVADPKAANYFNNTWTAKGKNVAELVENMKKSGLTFAPAAAGDEAAYRAVYLALRSFDTSLQASKQ